MPEKNPQKLAAAQDADTKENAPDNTPDNAPDNAPQKANKAQSLAIVVGIVVVAAIGAWNGQYKRQHQGQSQSAQARIAQPGQGAASSLRHAATDLQLANGHFKLIDFGMGVCSQCKSMQPVMEDMAQKLKGRAEVFSLDVREPNNNRLGSQFKLRLIPLIVLVDGSGREVWRHVGYIDAPQLLSATNKYIH